MRMLLLLAFSFLVNSNLIAMEQQQCPDNDRLEKLHKTEAILANIDMDRFISKWLDGSDKTRIKSDGCLVGDIDKPIIAKCDSWLKVQIELNSNADITFSADAVFMNGKIRQYSQNFPYMYGCAEITLPVAEGCRITATSTPIGFEPWAGFILIPMKDDVISSYHKNLDM